MLSRFRQQGCQLPTPKSWHLGTCSGDSKLGWHDSRDYPICPADCFEENACDTVRFPVAAAFVAVLAAPALAQPPVPFDDAGIHAVQFIDQSEGWAVGDDGVIWHSIDGGKTWERQKTGTRASLRGVHFQTPYTGWAVGRIETAERRRRSA